MFKGKAEIILTDIKNGKKTITKEENLVTNSLQNFANINMYDIAFGKSLVPLKSFFNGIFLLSETIDETPDNYVLPYTCELIGHAGTEITNGSIMKGSFNSIESEDLKNGYKFVWDFDTTQANGVIKCLSLVRGKIGDTGIGSENYEKAKSWEKELLYWSVSNSAKSMHYFMDENTSVVFAYSSNVLSIKKYNIVYDRLSLVNGASPELIETKNVQLSETIEYPIYFVDHDKLYMSNGRGSTLKVYIIDLIRYSVLDILEIGKITDNLSTNSGIGCSIIEKRLFLFDIDGSGDILQFDLGNISNYVKIKKSFERRSYQGTINNRIFFTNAVLENGKMRHTRSYSDGWPTQGVKIYSSLFNNTLLCGTSTGDGNRYGVNRTSYFYMNPFNLQTINNLSTPIIKNSTQTMKITYEITE